MNRKYLQGGAASLDELNKFASEIVQNQVFGEDSEAKLQLIAKEQPKVLQQLFQIWKQSGIDGVIKALQLAQKAAKGAKLNRVMALSNRCPSGYMKKGGTCKKCEEAAKKYQGVFNVTSYFQDGGWMSKVKKALKLTPNPIGTEKTITSVYKKSPGYKKEETTIVFPSGRHYVRSVDITPKGNDTTYHQFGGVDNEGHYEFDLTKDLFNGASRYAKKLKPVTANIVSIPYFQDGGATEDAEKKTDPNQPIDWSSVIKTGIGAIKDMSKDFARISKEKREAKLDAERFDKMFNLQLQGIINLRTPYQHYPAPQFNPTWMNR